MGAHHGLRGGGITLVPEGGCPCTTKDQLVTEHIRHIEPPAQRDEEVLAMKADLEWADWVEEGLRQPAAAAAAHVQPSIAAAHTIQVSDDESIDTEFANCPRCSVHILHFGSPPTSGHSAIKVFQDRLLSGP